MDKGQFATYTIAITNLKDNIEVQGTSQALVGHSVLGQYQRIAPPTDEHPGEVHVPRLFTIWRGDDEEQKWEISLRANLRQHTPDAAIAVISEPWSMLPGYPQGQL